MSNRIEIELCPVCEKVLNHNDKQGLAVSIVYSKGGWGSARDMLHLGNIYKPENRDKPIVNSDEICNECWNEIVPPLDAATKIYQNRRGINRPKEVKL